jgi:nitroreductase
VVAYEQHHLGDREQLEHRDPLQAGNTTGGAAERLGDETWHLAECRECPPSTVPGMEVDQAIRGRRTHKAFAPEEVPRQLLDELLELARWAPNHHLTNPWRFRVIGPHARAALKEAAGPEAAAKLDRAPTLVAVTARRDSDPVRDQEDLCATACAIYAVLLAAHGRGLAGYWRTPEVLRSEAGREALGIPGQERFVGLIHLGWAQNEKQPPERLPRADVVTYLE